MKKTNDNPLKALGIVSAVGIDLASCVTLGFFGGQYVSERTDQVLWLAAGVVLGLAAGIVSVFYVIKKFTEDSDG